MRSVLSSPRKRSTAQKEATVVDFSFLFLSLYLGGQGSEADADFARDIWHPLLDLCLGEISFRGGMESTLVWFAQVLQGSPITLQGAPAMKKSWYPINVKQKIGPNVFTVRNALTQNSPCPGISMREITQSFFPAKRRNNSRGRQPIYTHFIHLSDIHQNHDSLNSKVL